MQVFKLLLCFRGDDFFREFWAFFTIYRFYCRLRLDRPFPAANYGLIGTVGLWEKPNICEDFLRFVVDYEVKGDIAR